MKYQLIVLSVFLQLNYGKSERNYSSDFNNVIFENERLLYATRMASYIDDTVDPCEDFHQYACGNYFKTNEQKAINGRFGQLWMMIDDLNDKIHDMLMNPSELQSDAYAKARTFYQSCFQADLYPYKESEVYLNLIESLGGWPILGHSWKEESFDWFNLTCMMKSYGINTVINEATYEDNSSYLQYEEFGFFPMDNDLYRPFSQEFKRNKEIAVSIMKLYGVSTLNAIKTFNEIVEFGKELEELQNRTQSTEDEESEDISLDQLIEFAPQINWTKFYSVLNEEDKLKNISITVWNKNFFKELPGIFYGDNIRRAANYFILKLLFKLHDELQEKKDHKVYCLKKAQKFMGPIIIMMFLESSYYDRNAADDILVMSLYVRMAFRDTIKASKWLDKKSIKATLEQIHSIDVDVLDPNYIVNTEKLNKLYSKLNPILEKHFHSNVLEAMQFIAKHNMHGYDIEVNAYFGGNTLTVSPGMFMRPVYYPELPKSYNFGSIGTILGHEFSHLMDGSQIGEDWWNHESTEEFEERAKCITDQYSSYRIDELRQPLNANLTTREDLADYGGIRFGFYGYKKWLSSNHGNIDMSKQTLPGLNMTDIQLFFLSFAQCWCESVKGYVAYKQMKKDGHSPGKYRTIGTLSNFDEFSKAFNCNVGSGMSPEKKCVLW